MGRRPCRWPCVRIPPRREGGCGVYDASSRKPAGAGSVGAERAAAGVCFSRGNMLELARDAADLQATVSIHGDLKTAKPAAQGAVTKVPT
jgi:hypothetical protein